MTRLVATFPVLEVTAGAASASRTISGVAVPWGVQGRVASGDVVVFERGSIDAGARPVALRDHDRNRPIGVVSDARDTGTALEATITVSRTADGDDALVLAGDGALPMFSVGVEPTDADYDADGVLHVHASDWFELSLLTIGAYAGARVATVTAAQGAPNMTMTDDPTAPAVPDDDELDDDTEPNDDIEDDEPAPPAGDGAGMLERVGIVPVNAGRGIARARARAHPFAGVGIRELARFIAAASGGDDRSVEAVRRITASPGARVSSIHAALADVTLVGTDNVGVMHRPGYQAELVEIVSHGSPIVNAIRQGDLERGDYPNKTFNAWTKTPQVALQSAEKVAINSTPVAIGATSVPVQTWATGNDLSQQLLDFGSPSFVEDYIRAAGVDYAEVTELYATTALLAVATPATVAAGASFLEVVGAMFGALDPTKVPAGGLFLAVSWDVWVGLMGVTVNDGPAFWNGDVSFGSMLPTANAGGLSIIVAPALPAATYLLGLRNAATWYDLPGTPFSLRAINVGQLGLDVAVYGYGAVGVQYPGALVKATVPPVIP